MKTNHVIASAFVLVAITLIACGSDPEGAPLTQNLQTAERTTTGDAGAPSQDDAALAPVVAPTVVAADAGADAAPILPACKALSNKACLSCCDLAYPTMAAALTAAIAQCACVKPGECAAECRTSTCAGKNATAACAACIQKAQTCAPASATACKADPACSIYLTCLDSCSP